MNTKKAVSLLLCIILALGACSCAQKADEASVPPQGQPDETHSDVSGQSDILVVVFSATGNTLGIAEMIAEVTGADLIEIRPTDPYTKEDLDHHDPDSRSSKEQNDPNARPSVENDIRLTGYKTVYLGYPIWWGKAPKIMFTFVEGTDFTGMSVIPFCTSGSSGIGTSADELALAAGSGQWLEGKRFSLSADKTEIEKWTQEMIGGEKAEMALHLLIDDTEVEVEWEDNKAVEALKELASNGKLVIQMSMYGGFEQVGEIGSSLPRDDRQTVTSSGDIVLYSGDSIVIFYGSNSWSYTRLGRITDKTQAEMEDLLGAGDVTVTIYLGE